MTFHLYQDGYPKKVDHSRSYQYWRPHYHAYQKQWFINVQVAGGSFSNRRKKRKS